MILKKRLKRDILIKSSENNGFIVEVGCAKFVYSDHHEMCRDLSDYLSNPKKYEKEYGSNHPDAGVSPYRSFGAGGLGNIHGGSLAGVLGGLGS